MFSSRYRKENIETARRLLSKDAANAGEEAIEDGVRVLQKQDTVWDEISQAIKNYQKPNCLDIKFFRLVYNQLKKAQWFGVKNGMFRCWKKTMC